MRSRYYTLLLVLLAALSGITPSFAAAREGGCSLRGHVVAYNNKQPIAEAKVELLEGKKAIAYSCTDKKGDFALSLAHRPKGRCYLRITHVGYETYTKRVDLEKSKCDLQTIVLKEITQDLDEVVVTSTRTMRHLKDLPVPTQVVTRTQIEKIAPTSVKDILLYSIPGIEFSQHGGITHISMQGYNADYIAFLIDGEEVAGLKSGSLDFSRLSPDNIQRVEFTKGAGSALYGSNAIAGVINIITRQYDKPFSAGASVGYNQVGSWTSHLQAGVKQKYFSNSLSGSYDREGGYTLQNRDNTQDFKVLRNDVYRVGNRLRITPGSSVRLGWDANLSRRTQFRDEYHNDLYDYYTNSLRASWQASPNYTVSALYNGDFSSRIRHFFQADEKQMEHKNFVQTLRLQSDMHLTEGSDISFGLEGHTESMRSSQINEGKDKKSIQYGVLFAQHLWKIRPDIDLLYGARADYHSNYKLHVSPKVTLSYKKAGWIARGGYAHGFKSPSVMDLYFNWSHQGMFYIYGNPDLKPETANQFLANVEWSNSSVSAAAGVTHTLFTDRITRRVDKQSNQHHVNIDGTSRMTVADANASWRICTGLTLTGSYTFTYAPMYKKINGQEVDLNIIRPHNLLLKVDAYKSWSSKWSSSFSLIGQYLSGISFNSVSKKKDSEELEIKKENYEGYPMLRATGSVSYNRWVTLSLSMDNILGYRANDINFQNASLSPGRVLYGKIAFQL